MEAREYAQKIEFKSIDRFRTWDMPAPPMRMGNAHFRCCSFDKCSLSSQRDPQKMMEIHDVRLEKCRLIECGMRRVILTDVLIEEPKIEEYDRSELLLIWGCFFKHVTLRGSTGNINLNGRTYDSRPDLIPPPMHEAFENARKKFYDQLDWALDIRDVSLRGLRIDGIPAHLIRRDPATQALVKRSKLLDGAWQKVDLEGTWWKAEISSHLSDGEGDLVLVAPRRDRSFSKQVDGIKRLRDAGIAELD
jgi:hypothetical protein